MQLFIGGACAGKRCIVRQRFDAAVWHSAYAGCRLEAWHTAAASSGCLVLEGWERWLAVRMANEPDDDGLRQAMAGELDALCEWEARSGGEAVLILLEMGRGIVPLLPEQRRLRDLNGWLAQDAAARCERVWCVWHGMLQQLSS
ncbi:bifunctional adenosylcobinamide kinase/adenosylcobinamide-phosphate guanylyltransferase [Billgrantia sp. C5P2]|uniref:bifunctional adenosylcobinamide kinase/adenosylcobinamide-phosphate guanylyltransferase n=1 Tax=Billgrantia sp. C5P2 TaxID=3436239 RepID=UPI003DA28312